MPAVELSAVGLPTLKAPAVEMPAVEFGAVELPTLEAPTVELPRVELGAVELPTLEAPTVELPTVELGAVEMPTLETPAVELPAIDLGAVKIAGRGLPGATTGNDPLIEIDGIGPAYDQRLRAAGVTTFAGLAAMTVDELAAIIQAPAWRKTDYADWIAQARAAVEHGVEALAQQPAMRSLQPDNLTLLAEVGEKTADALRAAGFYSFASLAAASPQELAAIVESAGLPGGDYAAWIQEAAERTTGSGRRRSVKPL
jgi:predicted flap endonuclease-1-like 5' DNA nuclease